MSHDVSILKPKARRIMSSIEPTIERRQTRKWLTRVLVGMLGSVTLVGCLVLLDQRTGFPSGIAAKVEIMDCTVSPSGEFHFHLKYTTFVSAARVQLITENSSGVREIIDLWEGEAPTSRMNDVVRCVWDSTGVITAEFRTGGDSTQKRKLFVATNQTRRSFRGEEILLFEEDEVSLANADAEPTTWRYLLRIE